MSLGEMLNREIPKEAEKSASVQDSQFQKYLLCEQHFGATAKKDVVSIVNGYLTTFKKNVMSTIRDRLEHVQRVDDYKEVSDSIETELSRLNSEFTQKFTEYLNTRKF